MTEINKLLSEGLISGYAGETKRQIVQNGPFDLESSQYQTPDGAVYIDNWIADRTGGGQEIAKSGEKTSTRLYGGGTISLKELEDLGLTKKDVTRYLKQKIRELGAKTRLFENCTPDPDGDWQYSYEIMENIENIPLTVDMESISFKGKRVFAHAFIRTTVE